MDRSSIFAVKSDSSLSLRTERGLPWLAGLLVLAPLIWCRTEFAELWWFGDDWDLLDQITRVGFARWTLQVFAENFVPVFKLLWGGMVFASGGSYFAMICALWATHALNVALLGRLLHAAGFGWPGTAFALAVFGLATSNHETLAWSVQWSAILAITFFLAAADWQQRYRAELQPWSWQIHGVLCIFVAASALSFSRGVLTGAALGLLYLVPLANSRIGWPARLCAAMVCVVPAVGVALVIFFASGGNHHAIGHREGLWQQAAEFGGWYWAVSPLHRLFEVNSWGLRTTLVLGLIKIAIIWLAFRCAIGSQRRLLALFLVLDLGNAVLLGLGRFHTTLHSTNGSRYQYNALLCTLPFVACLLERALCLIKHRVWRASLATALIAIMALHSARKWPVEMQMFAAHRGRNTRQLLLHEPNPPPMGAVPGINFMATKRAKELIAHYHLH